MAWIWISTKLVNLCVEDAIKITSDDILMQT